MLGIVAQGKDFRFYITDKGKPWKHFMQRSNVIKFLV